MWRTKIRCVFFIVLIGNVIRTLYVNSKFCFFKVSEKKTLNTLYYFELGYKTINLTPFDFRVLTFESGSG